MEVENIVGEVSQSALAEHRAYVLGSVTLSVAFLEANINELVTDVKHGVLGEWNGLDSKTIDALNRKLPKSKRGGGAGGRRSEIIAKYDRINRHLDRIVFDRGGFLSKEIALLIRLRDELIHPRPEWIPGAGLPDTSEGKPALRHELRSKYKLNPLMPTVNPLFPDRCLSHGCAEWAVKSSIDFVDEFSRGLGIVPIFDPVRSELMTE